jgi:hypothetical protein
MLLHHNHNNQSRPSHRSGFFSGRSSNDGSGPGKNDGPGGDDDSDGLPKFPQTQSVQDTQNRLDNIDEYGLVSFTDGVTNKHRTIVKMSPERIQKLAKDGFHMFPEK